MEVHRPSSRSGLLVNLSEGLYRAHGTRLGPPPHSLAANVHQWKLHMLHLVHAHGRSGRSSRNLRNRRRFRLESLEGRVVLSSGLQLGDSAGHHVAAMVHRIARPKQVNPNLVLRIADGPNQDGQITLQGHTYGRALVHLDLDGNGTVDQTVKADRKGNFTAIENVAYGVTTISAKASVGAKTTAAISLAVNRPDTVAPTVVLSSHILGWHNTQDVVTGRVYDLQTGVNDLEVSIDGGAPQPVAFDSTGFFRFTTSFALDGSQDGTHILTFWAHDRAGNVSSGASEIYLFDANGPTIDVQSPFRFGPGGSVNYSQAPDFQGTVSDPNSGIASFALSIDSGDYVNIPIDANGAFDVASGLSNDGTQDGFHTWELIATDPAGNSKIISGGFELDAKVAPKIISPIDGAVVQSNVEVSGTITPGTTPLQAWIDSNPPIEVTVDNTGHFSFTTSFALDGSQNGKHTITLSRQHASDAFAVDTASVSFNLDAPTLT